MRIKFLSLIFLLLPIISSAQLRPESFKLEKEDLSKTLNSKGSTPLSNSISEIEITGDTVWIGTSRGLSYTADDGKNWTNYFGDDVFGTEGIYALTIYHGIIIAATGHTETGLGGESVPTGSGLRISTDGGVNWITVPQSVDNPGDSSITYGINQLRILPVTVKQQNVTYDIAVLNDTVYATSWAGGLRRASLQNLIDAPDKPWERVVLPPDYLDSIKPSDTLHFSVQPVAGAFGPEEYLNHVAFGVAVSDSGYIFVGTANGINKSTDGGTSWVKFNHQNQQNPISGNFITSLDYDNSTHTIWATTWPAIDAYAYYGVSASSDGGATWQVFLGGEKGHGFGFLQKGNQSNVMVATDNGLFRTTDNGRSWLLPGEIRQANSGNSIETSVFYSAAAKPVSALQSQIWLGSSNGLAMLDEGTTIWDGNWKVFLASQPLNSSANESYAMPNPYNPDFRNLRIKYFVNNSGSGVTIRILNFNMQIIRTLLQNAIRSSGENLESWDGKDENGTVVPNGVYFYTIEENNNFNSYGKIIVVR